MNIIYPRLHKSEKILKHILHYFFTHFLFNFPGPPYFFLSLQYLHCPQSWTTVVVAVPEVTFFTEEEPDVNLVIFFSLTDNFVSPVTFLFFAACISEFVSLHRFTIIQLNTVAAILFMYGRKLCPLRQVELQIDAAVA